jgi:hypothetical protein
MRTYIYAYAATFPKIAASKRTEIQDEDQDGTESLIFRWSLLRIGLLQAVKFKGGNK